MPTTAQTQFTLDTLDLPRFFPHMAYKEIDHWELLQDLGPTLSLSEGYAIHSTEKASYCYLVIDGIIEAFVELVKNQVNQSAFFLHGSMFLEPSALSNLSSSLIYKAITAAKVVRINREDLKQAMMSNGDIFDFVMLSSTLKLNAVREQLRETQLFDVRARVYFLLLGIAVTCSDDEGNGWYHLTLKLTQQQMSDMLVVNRVTVNTALQDLYDAHMVKKYDGRYAVFDEKHILKERHF